MPSLSYIRKEINYLHKAAMTLFYVLSWNYNAKYIKYILNKYERYG